MGGVIREGLTWEVSSGRVSLGRCHQGGSVLGGVIREGLSWEVSSGRVLLGRCHQGGSLHPEISKNLMVSISYSPQV